MEGSAFSTTGRAARGLRMRGRGCVGWSRRRSGYSRLAAFLAARAELVGIMRALDPNECAGGRSCAGRFHRMLNDHRSVVFRRSRLAPEHSYRAVDLGRGIAAVEALGGHSGTVARLPDGGVG